MSCEHEMRFRLYYSQTQDYVEVCEDPDGLGLTEIRYRDEDEQIKARITLHDDQIDMLIRSLNALREFRASKLGAIT